MVGALRSSRLYFSRSDPLKRGRLLGRYGRGRRLGASLVIRTVRCVRRGQGSASKRTLANGLNRPKTDARNVGFGAEADIVK